MVKLVPEELRGKTFIRQGNPAFEVVAAARKLKAGLIVLSTTGRSGLGRIVLGSTAERIVRYAHCSVMTVRRQPAVRFSRTAMNSDYANVLTLRNVLVPIDLSARSFSALQTAVALLGTAKARLLLLHVIDVSPAAFAPEGVIVPLPREALVAAAKKDLARVAREFVPKSLRCQELVLRGGSAESIVRVARTKHVDLIVLSTHGRTGIRRWFMGSTAESVVRKAQCPVLVAR
jgi:nucleotide-binding universal stress UspA family protein